MQPVCFGFGSVGVWLTAVANYDATEKPDRACRCIDTPPVIAEGVEIVLVSNSGSIRRFSAATIVDSRDECTRSRNTIGLKIFCDRIEPLRRVGSFLGRP
jgi:hypothetical protein